jgi:hypothetical protein
VIGVVLLVAAGCVERSRGRTEEEEREVRRSVTSTAPAPAHALGASFDGKIELLGYDVAPEILTPGRAAKVTWYWKCVRPLDEDGWRLFTHLSEGTGAARENFDEEGTIRRLYPPSEWKAGEYVKDEQRVELPEDWAAHEAVFSVGVWRDEERLAVKSGPHDAENRVPVRVPTTARAPAPLPRLRIPKAAGPLALDGNLDEADWARAARTGPFVNTMTGRRLPFSTEAHVLWTSDAIWIGFDCEDHDLHSPFEKRDDHLWEADAVEVFLDPGGDGRNYYEIQVSPKNVLFDSRLPRYRQNQNDWQSHTRTGVHVDGTLDDDEEDRGWRAEMSIPWSDLTDVPAPLHSPPVAGDVWRANLFRMEWRDESIRGAGWSPPKKPDFHTLDRFGEWEWVGP